MHCYTPLSLSLSLSFYTSFIVVVAFFLHFRTLPERDDAFALGSAAILASRFLLLASLRA